jgi:hypothetical protein
LAVGYHGVSSRSIPQRQSGTRRNAMWSDRDGRLGAI